MADPAAGLDLSNVLGGLTSLGGLGLSAYSQNQQNGILQNALNTIGPTQLQAYNLAGPGGMSAGYNPNGGASIGLGSLNPAFAGLVGSGTNGTGLYNPNMLAGLTGTAYGTENTALGALNGAYGGNNIFQNAALTQAGSLNNTYNSVYGNTLNSLQQMQAPQVQQQAFGLQNTLFGSGTLNSAGAASGALAAGNFGSQVNAMNAQDAMSAQQQALGAMQGQAGIAGSLSGTGNSLLSNAFANFGNTNQLISGLNTAQLNNSLQALQGAGALNTLGLNNYMAALQTGSAQANAKNLSLFPYAGVATALAGSPTATGMLASGLSGMGSSLLGGNGGLQGLISGIGNSLSGLFGGNGSLSGGGMSGFINSLGGDGPGSPDMSNIGVPSTGIGEQALNADLGNFSGAGGQAATPATTPSVGNIAGGIGNAAGIAGGLAQGGLAGYGNAAVNAGSLAARAGAFGSNTGMASNGLAGAGNVLGIYNGLRQGGVGGYAGAAVNAAQLGSRFGAFGGLSGTIGQDAGYAAIPLSLYNFGKNWQSGATGSDALNGASAGASIGTAILPGVGTAIGAVGGALVGGLSSAFGGGRADPETTSFNNFVQQNAQAGGGLTSQLNGPQAYQMLAGMMDAKNNTAGHSTQLEMTFGRMGEGNLMDQMTTQINSAIKSGQIGGNATPQQIYQTVVMPWLQSKNAYVPANAIISSNGTRNNGTVDSLLTQLISQWQSGSLNAGTQAGISGQTIAGLPAYAGKSGSQLIPV